MTQELIFKQTSHWIISINQLTNSTVFVDQKNPDTIHLLVSLQQLSKVRLIRGFEKFPWKLIDDILKPTLLMEK